MITWSLMNHAISSLLYSVFRKRGRDLQPVVIHVYPDGESGSALTRENGEIDGGENIYAPTASSTAATAIESSTQVAAQLEEEKNP